MKVYFDSSVLVAALLKRHERHERAAVWFERVVRGRIRATTSAHGIAETWSSLTGTPLSPRIPSPTAEDMIRSAILDRFDVVEAGAQDYEDLLGAAARLDALGGSVYDALHIAMARKSRADVVLTLDLRDFRRVGPDLARRIREP